MELNDLFGDTSIVAAIAAIFAQLATFLNSTNNQLFGGLVPILSGLAPAVTVLGGLYTYIQKRKYADRNMPKRINEYLERQQMALTNGHRILASTIERPSATRPLTEPVVNLSHMKRALKLFPRLHESKTLLDPLRKLVRGKRGVAATKIGDAIRELQHQHSTAEDIAKNLSERLEIAHSLKGSIEIANGAHTKGREKANTNNSQARSEFAKALALNSSNLCARASLAQHLAMLNDHGTSYSEYETLENTSDTRSPYRVESLKGQALLRAQTGVYLGATGAINRIGKAIDQVPNGYDPMKFGDLYELKGDFQRAQGVAHGDSYKEAVRKYQTVNTVESERAIERVGKKTTGIISANQYPAPATATNTVNTTQTEIRRAASPDQPTATPDAKPAT